MQGKALRCLWMLMAALVVSVAVTLPAFVPSPLTPPKLTACNDKILDPTVCIEQKRTTVYCCINGMQWVCREVRWWVHKENGTDYYRTDKGTVCEDIGLVCSPTTGECK